LSSPSVLSSACFLDPRYLELGYLPNPIALDLTECQVQVPWVSHVCQTHITLNLASYQA